MGREIRAIRSFLQGLLQDTTANTLAIAAAALIPLLAMVGSGVDASRYYMTATRMQAACDAGALAARRAMTDDTFTTAHQTVGNNFFDQNFETEMFGTRDLSREYTSEDGVVYGEASGTLDTTIMRTFGYDDLSIEVTCTAEINISNTDIMFVLDVTGSMSQCPNGNECNSNASSKIVGLRSAVMNFYDTVEDATSDSAQVRYGFVPYSQQVNVGFLLPRAYLADQHVYQSRVAVFRNSAYVNNNVGDYAVVVSDKLEWLPRDTADFNTSPVNNYRYRSDGQARTNAENFCRNLPGTYNVNVNGQTQRWQVVSGTTVYVLNQWSNGDSNNRAACYGQVRRYRQVTEEDRLPVFSYWRYCQVDTSDSTPCNVSNPANSPAGWETVSLSSIYDDNQIDLPVGNNGAMITQTWSGCIEEPIKMDTTGNYSPIASDAYDLLINHVPQNEAQKWKPSLHNAVWERRNSNGERMDPATAPTLNTNATQSRPGWVCPRAATRLAEMERSAVQSYVNSLSANGNTYHDIGMLWGARLIAPRGLFRQDNEKAPNGDAIGRHIVFMTDGELVTDNEMYSTQGIEFWDRRVTGDGADATERTRRAARLQAICSSAKSEGITVWVVAFGTEMTDNLKTCASPGRDYTASNSATLNEAFQEIAQKIAALRLTS